MVVLGGCGRENPWFIVDDDDSSPSSPSSDTGSGPADTGTAGTSTVADTGTVDTTGPVGPDETGGGGTDGMTGTGGLDSTGDEETAGTTGTTDGSDTTGGPSIEGELWYDLWWRCDHQDTQWSASGAVPGSLNCWTSLDEPPDQWVGPRLPVLFMDQLESKVLALVPAPGDGNGITGAFGGLTLPPAAATPHLRAVVVCPNFVPKCQIVGTLRVERGMKVVVGVEDIPLGQGEYGVIDIDLAKFPALLDGQPFTVIMGVTLKGEAPGNRGLWLAPRIVELTD